MSSPKIASPKNMAIRFLDLPAELRILIYSYTIAPIPPPVDLAHSFLFHKRRPFPDRLPFSFDLYSSRGFILSCKTVYHEFEHEWLKVYGLWFAEQFTIYDQVLPTINKIGDTTNIRIGLSFPSAGWLDDSTKSHTCVAELVYNLPSFCLYPISLHASDNIPLTGEQIQRFEPGAEGKKHSVFLHVTRLLAVSVYSTWYRGELHGLHVGENFECIAMKWAWKEVANLRKTRVGWEKVEYRTSAFPFHVSANDKIRENWGLFMT